MLDRAINGELIGVAHVYSFAKWEEHLINARIYGWVRSPILSFQLIACDYSWNFRHRHGSSAPKLCIYYVRITYCHSHMGMWFGMAIRGAEWFRPSSGMSIWLTDRMLSVESCGRSLKSSISCCGRILLLHRSIAGFLELSGDWHSYY